jgi:nitrogen fixation NifU-like protein
MAVLQPGDIVMASDAERRVPLDGTDRGTEGVASSAEDPFLGRMTDPSGSAYIRGACGEEMEFYLEVRDDVICRAKYYTEGCDDTRRYARAVAMAAQGKGLLDALSISPRQIMDDDASLTEGSRHCAILAVMTLYRAIAEYLMQP